MWRFLGLVALVLLVSALGARPHPAHAEIYGYAGWATYYGIEDGVRPGDVMYDGTPYNPDDPTITSGSVLFPIHTWLLVCSQVKCIEVQVRDRGYLDQYGVLLDLSRAAYYTLFGGLGGRQWINAYYLSLVPATNGAPPSVSLAPQPGAAPSPVQPPPTAAPQLPPADVPQPPALPTPTATPKPQRMNW